MITNLYFVRHAHSIYTPEDLKRPLSDQGFMDSKKVAEMLKKENIDQVISSPYLRSIQTVSGISEYINKDIIIEYDLRERLISDQPVDDFEKAMKKLWDDFTFNFENGESNEKAQLRGIEIIKKILKTYNEKNVVIGTHGNIMVLIMNYFDKTYNIDFWRKLNMPDIYKLSFKENLLQNVERIWNEN